MKPATLLKRGSTISSITKKQWVIMDFKSVPFIDSRALETAAAGQ